MEADGNSYKLAANVTKVIRWPSFTYTVHTNSFGFRDKKTGDPNINGHEYYVFLGASEVFANGVDYDKSFVGLVANYASSKEILILNMAVGGHHFLSQESLFKNFMQRVQKKPSKVFFCVNPMTIMRFEKMNNDVIVRNGELFPRAGWRIAYLKSMAAKISLAYCFFRDNIRKLQFKWFGHPVSNNDKEFLQMFSRQNRLNDGDVRTRLERHFADFESYCHQWGIQVIYVYFPIVDAFRLQDFLIPLGLKPDEYDPSYYEKLMDDYCRRKKMQLLNPAPMLKKHFEAGIKLRFDMDPHFNEFANQAIGEYLIQNVFNKENQ